MAVSERIVPEEPELTTEERQVLAEWGQRRRLAKDERRRYEPTWTMCKMFLSGRQWVGIHPRTGRVINDTRFEHRERHTVNVLDQYMQTVLGKLYVEDLRPELLFSREDLESQNITEHTRGVAKYLWDTEINADERIFALLTKFLTYGTAALRCLYDPSKGNEIGEVPIGPDGSPILDIEMAVQYVSQLQAQGQQARFQMLREGVIEWEPLGPGQILVPPGIEDDRNFPWLIIERAVPVTWAQMRYPEVADRLREEVIRTVDSLDARELAEPDDTSSTPNSQRGLKEHLIVSTGYELPCPKYPRGRTIVWNDSNKVILSDRQELPYKLRGQPHHGVIFYHYHRVPGRFWSLGLIEPLIGPQRQKNRARSQMIEMKDRNLGRVYARKGAINVSNKPVGKIMELIELPLHVDMPVETAGTPVGPWIQNEAEINDADMDRVAGLREVSLGSAPTGVSAYSAMALLAEQDERRVGPVLKLLRNGIADTMILSLEIARRYWPSGRKIAVSGPDGILEMLTYQRNQLPTEFFVDVARSAPLPTSPAVESQKIFDIFNAATSAGQPLPIDWLKASLDQGKALPIPKREEQVQAAKAEQENLMLLQGLMVQPDYYDDDFIHVQVHRQAQMEAGLAQETAMYAQQLEMHIQMHAQNAAMKKPTGVGGGNQLPQDQGSRGIEAQNGMNLNMQGAAQQQAAEQSGG